MITALLAVAVLTGPPAPEPSSLRRTVAVYAVPVALDFITTEYALSTGEAYEANPLLVNRAVRFGVKSAALVGFVALDRHYQKQGKSTRRLRVAYLAVNVLIVASNVKTILGARARTR